MSRVQAAQELRCARCGHRSDAHHVVYVCTPGERARVVLRCAHWVGAGRRCPCTADLYTETEGDLTDWA